MPPPSLTQLIRSHAAPMLRAACIERWAQAHGLCLDDLPAESPVIRQRRAAEGPGLEAARRDVAVAGLAWSLKDLEALFEAHLGAGHRKTQGATYTPEGIIDYLVETGLELGGSAPGGPLICDPACGSAGFLLRAALILWERYGLAPIESFRDHLIGFDNDPLALENARCLIELFLLQHGVEVAAVPLRLFLCDSLLAPTEELWRLGGTTRGFDLVATNPPYVKLQNLDLAYRLRIAAAYAPFVQGSFSLAPLFMVAGHRMLAPGGCMAAITQNNLATSLSGEPVRAYLQAQGALRRILNFGHHQVFERVSAYTCVMFLGRESQDSFEYGESGGEVTLEGLRQVPFASLASRELKAAKWRWAAPRHLANLRRIETTGRPLGELAELRVGFATLKDAVFLARQEGEVAIARPPDGRSYELELAATRPALKIAELGAGEDLARNTLRVIFPYEKVGLRHRLLTEPELRERYPRAFAYLMSQRDWLEARDKGRRAYPAWYAWGRTQGQECPGPKLLTKTFSEGPNFILDPSDRLICNGYAVLPREGTDLEVLAKILNSRVMAYYAKLTSFQIAGGFLCFQKNFIEGFGIPELSAAARREVRRLEGDALTRFLAGCYGLEAADLIGPPA